MKRIIRHPITIIVFIVIIVVIFALAGFRITYDPSLDNNWDAVSACASWLSVIVSALAIWYAIQVPKKIAIEQNRITLFEKRYTEIEKIRAILTEFDRIKSQIELLLSKSTNKKGAIQIVAFCTKSTGVISDNTSMMYQYLFNQNTCDRIKFMHSANAMILVKLIELNGVLYNQRYVSITDRDWYRITSKDEELQKIQSEILDICSKVLLLEEDISKEMGKCMDLRHL